MSTPTTLSSTHPTHHPNYGYSRHQNYQPNSGYRTNNTLLNGGSRLGASHNIQTASSNDQSSNIRGVADTRRPIQNVEYHSDSDTNPPTMPPSAAASKQPPRKRQRSKEPDWEKFYENGLPEVVIVIDDSPTPEQSVISNGKSSHTVAEGSSRHAAKKRKHNEEGAVYDTGYQAGSVSNHPSPHYKDSGSGSTASTDRTTSAIHTTAATSLGSHSSNGQNGFEPAEPQPGQKRKRNTTRLQLANDAKRKELEVNGDAYTNYRPPPRPPIKAPDVLVKQVADVSPSIPTKLVTITDISSRTLTRRIVRSMMRTDIILLCQTPI
jgi:dual-specificity kinase